MPPNRLFCPSQLVPAAWRLEGEAGDYGKTISWHDIAGERYPLHDEGTVFLLIPTTTTTTTGSIALVFFCTFLHKLHHYFQHILFLKKLASNRSSHEEFDFTGIHALKHSWQDDASPVNYNRIWNIHGMAPQVLNCNIHLFSQVQSQVGEQESNSQESFGGLYFVHLGS